MATQPNRRLEIGINGVLQDYQKNNTYATPSGATTILTYNGYVNDLNGTTMTAYSTALDPIKIEMNGIGDILFLKAPASSISSTDNTFSNSAYVLNAKINNSGITSKAFIVQGAPAGRYLMSDGTTSTGTTGSGGSGGVGGSGTINKLPKFTGTAYLGDSNLNDNGTVISATTDMIINGMTVGKGGGQITDNVVIGRQSLQSNTTGVGNTVVGDTALISNTTGSNNVAIGARSQQSATGIGNVAVGVSTLGYASGWYNTAVGDGALGQNNSGESNVAIGHSALAQNTSGYYNVSIGKYSSLFNRGTNNVVIGSEAFSQATTGSKNTIVGDKTAWQNGAGVNLTALTYSTILGSDIRPLNHGDTNSIIIGSGANGIGSNTAVYGNDAITKSAIKGIVTIGTTASTGNNKLQVFTDATINELTVGKGAGTGLYNTALGKGALATNQIGDYNVAIGNNALASNRSYYNVAVGAGALANTISGSNNTAIGTTSLNQNGLGDYNTAVGSNTLVNNTSGANNTCIGAVSLQNNTTGSNNSALGWKALNNNQTGNNNIGIGREALIQNGSGNENIAIGYQGGQYIADGSNANINPTSGLYIGNYTKSLTSGSTNEIVIGYNATGNGTNSVTLGNNNISSTALKGAVTFNNSATLDSSGGANTFVKFKSSGTNVALFGSDGAINGLNPLNFGIFCYGANDIEFSTNGTRQLIVKGNGNILMGKTNDDTINKLQVSGSVVSTQFRLSALNTAPATSTSTGTLGEIRVVSGFIYVCIATNSWQRVQLLNF